MTVGSEPRTARCAGSTASCTDALDGALTSALPAQPLALPPDLLREVFARELRAPLTPIMGMVQLFLHRYGTELNEQQRQMLQSVDRSSRRLLRLLDDLLVLQGDPVDGPVAHRQPVPVRAALDEVVSHLAIPVDAVGDLDTPVLIDRRHLEQILERLLDNASRWGAPPVRVEVRAGLRVQVRVIDHGDGVEGAVGPLWTVGEEARGRRAGLGLGLPAAQRLVRANRGQLRYERPDGTTSFTLELQRAPAGSSPSTAPDPPAGDSLADIVARLLISHDVVAPLQDLVRDSLPDVGAGEVAGLEALDLLLARARACPTTWSRWGDVLPDLVTAARERAAGLLTPVRSVRRSRSLFSTGANADVLVGLTVVGLPPRHEGTTWSHAAIDDRLRRTLTTRLGEHDAALRWPRDRFLVLLRRPHPSRVERFAQGVAREWEARLGAPPLAGNIGVRATIVTVPAGDLAGAIRRVNRAGVQAARL